MINTSFHIFQGVSGTGRLVKVGFLDIIFGDFQILAQLVSSNTSHQDVLLLIGNKQRFRSVDHRQLAKLDRLLTEVVFPVIIGDDLNDDDNKKTT